jgi:hypothetical protein
VNFLKRFIIALACFFFFLKTTPLFAVTFTIANPKTDKEVVSIDVSLSGLTSSSCASSSCYLQAGLRAFGEREFFGFTRNGNGEWYEYKSEPGINTITTTFFSFSPVGGAWSGTLSVKANPTDTKYKGPGTYTLRVWRYSGKTNGPTGDPSEDLPIDIIQPTLTPTSSPTPTSTLTPTDAPTPTNTPKNTPTPTSTVKQTITPSKKPTLIPTQSQNATISSEAAVLGESQNRETNTEATQSGGRFSAKPWIFGLLFIGLGMAVLSLALIFRRTMRAKDKFDILKL